MSDSVYFQLKSFPDLPFTIESVSEKEDELVFELSAKNPEQEDTMDSVEFRNELRLFLEEMVKELVERAKEALGVSELPDEAT